MTHGLFIAITIMVSIAIINAFIDPFMVTPSVGRLSFIAFLLLVWYHEYIIERSIYFRKKKKVSTI